ncbi:MAG TPA: hypothetical protein PLD25_19755 [Chloroflexota bacterium]|nr:hypothetical protein [Chloroflexota bacterium]HUM68616.1 hypothetical protein [Chloroflexota bacterium]
MNWLIVLNIYRQWAAIGAAANVYVQRAGETQRASSSHDRNRTSGAVTCRTLAARP